MQFGTIWSILLESNTIWCNQMESDAFWHNLVESLAHPWQASQAATSLFPFSSTRHCVVSPFIINPTFFDEKVKLSLQATAALCWWRCLPKYIPRLSHQSTPPDLRSKLRSFTSLARAKPTPERVTMPWSVAKEASQASRRVGSFFCWGSSCSASGCADAPAPIASTGGLPALYYWSTAADRLPTSKYAS